MSVTKNLGFVKAIQSGSTPPSNTKMVWWDTNENLHKAYNTETNSWVPLGNLDPEDFVKKHGDTMIGELGLPSIQLDVEQDHTTELLEGQTRWNSHDQTIEFGTKDGRKVQINQEIGLPVRNSTGGKLLNGRCVRINGYNGSYYTIEYSDNRTKERAHVDFILSADVEDGEMTVPTKIGLVRDIDTSSCVENDTIYLGEEGNWTCTRPTSPRYIRPIGHIGKVATSGEIYVSIANQEQGDIEEQLLAANMPHGIPIEQKQNITLQYCPANRELICSGSFYYFINTEKIIANAIYETVVHPNASGTYFYILSKNILGNPVLIVKNTFFTLGTDIPLAIVIYNNAGASTFWGGANGKLLCERHGCEMDKATHFELHNNLGCYATSGFALAGYQQATGTGSLADNTFSIDSGKIYDEDNHTLIPTLPDNNGVGANYNVWYKLGNNWFWYKSNLPYLLSTEMQVNTITGGSGALVNLTGNKFVNMWIVGTPELDKTTGLPTNDGFGFIVGQKVYTSLASATGESFFDLDLSGFPSAEVAPLWQITFRRSPSYESSIGYVRIENVRRIVGTRFVSGTQAVSQNIHNNLAGRDVEDAHPATAISAVPFGSIVGTNVQTVLEEIKQFVDDSVSVKVDKIETPSRTQQRNLISLSNDGNITSSNIYYANSTYDLKAIMENTTGFITVILTQAITLDGFTINNTATEVVLMCGRIQLGGIFTINGDCIINTESPLVLNDDSQIINSGGVTEFIFSEVYSNSPSVSRNLALVNNGINTFLYYEHLINVSIQNINGAYSGLGRYFSGVLRSEVLLRENNLSDLDDKQNALNIITQVSGATNEYVLTKDTLSGNAIWKEAQGGSGGDAYAEKLASVTEVDQYRLMTSDSDGNIARSTIFYIDTYTKLKTILETDITGCTIIITKPITLSTDTITIRCQNAFLFGQPVTLGNTTFNGDSGDFDTKNIWFNNKLIMPSGDRNIIQDAAAADFILNIYSNSLSHITQTNPAIYNTLTITQKNGGENAVINFIYDDTDPFVRYAASYDNSTGSAGAYEGVTFSNMKYYKKYCMQFALPEDLNNNATYFYSYGKFTSGTDNIRSGGSTGFADPNQVMPILSSCKGRVLKATCVLRGAAVWNGSVTYPCTFRCELWKVGFSTEGTKLGDIDFSISDAYTVGTYNTSVTTNFQGSIMLDILVEDGDMLALKWVPLTSPAASGIAGMKNAIVTLTII